MARLGLGAAGVGQQGVGGHVVPPAGHPLVRPLRREEQRWLEETVRERWPHQLLVGRGRVRQIAELSALVAVQAGERVGLLTYIVEGDTAELVTFDALRSGLRVGPPLIEALVDRARDRGARRVVAMATNDSVWNLGYYQRLGFRMNELRAGAMEELRARMPWIPKTGQDGIPVRDEIELVRDI